MACNSEHQPTTRNQFVDWSNNNPNTQSYNSSSSSSSPSSSHTDSGASSQFRSASSYYKEASSRSLSVPSSSSSSSSSSSTLALVNSNSNANDKQVGFLNDPFAENEPIFEESNFPKFIPSIDLQKMENEDLYDLILLEDVNNSGWAIKFKINIQEYSQYLLTAPLNLSSENLTTVADSYEGKDVALVDRKVRIVLDSKFNKNHFPKLTDVEFDLMKSNGIENLRFFTRLRDLIICKFIEKYPDSANLPGIESFNLKSLEERFNYVATRTDTSFEWWFYAGDKGNQNSRDRNSYLKVRNSFFRKKSSLERENENLKIIEKIPNKTIYSKEEIASFKKLFGDQFFSLESFFKEENGNYRSLRSCLKDEYDNFFLPQNSCIQTFVSFFLIKKNMFLKASLHKTIILKSIGPSDEEKKNLLEYQLDKSLQGGPKFPSIDFNQLKSQFPSINFENIQNNAGKRKLLKN